MTDTTYNGWTNYETWVVNLWLENDGNDYLLEMAENSYKSATPEYGLTKLEIATNDLSNRLKDMVEEQNPLTDKPSMFSDLLNAALGEVIWHEIAEALISNIQKEIKSA